MFQSPEVTGSSLLPLFHRVKSLVQCLRSLCITIHSFTFTELFSLKAKYRHSGVLGEAKLIQNGCPILDKSGWGGASQGVGGSSRLEEIGGLWGDGGGATHRWGRGQMPPVGGLGGRCDPWRVGGKVKHMGGVGGAVATCGGRGGRHYPWVGWGCRCDPWGVEGAVATCGQGGVAGITHGWVGVREAGWTHGSGGVGEL